MTTDKNKQSTALISARGISKSYNHSASGSLIEILKGVEIDIASGDMLAVVGASGIGKSTLLNILGTLDRPDSGSLYYQGEDVFSYDDRSLAMFRNVSVGFVFQFHYLLSEFSAIENTMIPVLIRGKQTDIAKGSAEEILVRVGLKDRLKHRVSELSGGEQQRVALARALVLKPLALLADEPTGNLDIRNSEKIHELLIELNRELRMTLIVVTHNVELAAMMSRRVTIIDGNLVDAG